MLNLLKILIHSNIFISLAAVSLTIATQIQLGMAPQWHPYLFIIFFATLFEYNIHRLITVIKNKDASRSRKQGGSGLGLSIVKHIIEAHDQTINVRSTSEIGSTFGFTLKKAANR